MRPCAAITRRAFLGQTLASIITLPAWAEPSPESGVLTLEAREGRLRLLPEPAPLTPVWGYNGAVPGPVLRIKKGQEVKVRLVNRLDQPTSLTWHGVRITNSMDGMAGLTQEPVEPGGALEYRFTPPDSGFYWYHPGVLPFFSEQLGRGLFGALIVEEPEPPMASRDLLVILSDWTLENGGQIAGFNLAADGMGAGRTGPLVCVNAQAAPAAHTLPPSSRLRLRILNAASARFMVMSFGGMTPVILALDGQPCESFVPARHMIPLAPGARADVMVGLPAGDGAEASLTLMGANEPDRALIVFKTAGDTGPALPPAGSLPLNPLLPNVIKLEASHRANIVIEANTPRVSEKDAKGSGGPPLFWKINGVALPGFPPAPLFSIKRGTPVTLRFVNRTPFVQQMHVHGHVLRLLHDLDDGWEPYWRDGVLIPEGKTKHAAFVADNPGKWAIVSGMAARQATGLAAWFLVT
ncbi:MAG TPA: multicopper oxidase family protein [Methylocella sp.]|nr:multicopper oxidase family protein [Methylocella sp.]